jgi:hypothetical protein
MRRKSASRESDHGGARLAGGRAAAGGKGKEYRAKWGLPLDYPMVAPSYAAQRSDFARSIGLGRKPKAVIAPEPVKARVGRKKAAVA